MPRRRRKISGNRLRPLMFTESPVNIVHKLPSPVFSSDNPATADVVSINGNVTWVSPQFLKAPQSCTQPRRTRRTTRSGIGEQLLPNSRKQRNVNHTLPIPPVSTKYKPLAFVGYDEADENDEAASICEDISVEEDVMKTAGEVIVQQGLSRNKKSENLCPDNYMNNEHIHGEETAAPSSHRQTDAPTEDSTVQTDINSGPLIANCEIDTPDLSPLRVNSNVPNVINSRTKFTHIKCKNPDENLEFTQNRPQNNEKRGKRYRRLFSTDMSAKDMEYGSDYDFDSIPRRRSQRIQRMKENFFPNSQFQTPVDQMKNNFQVLVYDTPEEDYGLSVRRRRLRDCASDNLMKR